jgi:hypothetical protein
MCALLITIINIRLTPALTAAGDVRGNQALAEVRGLIRNFAYWRSRYSNSPHPTGCEPLSHTVASFCPLLTPIQPVREHVLGVNVNSVLY